MCQSQRMTDLVQCCLVEGGGKALIHEGAGGICNQTVLGGILESNDGVGVERGCSGAGGGVVIAGVTDRIRAWGVQRAEADTNVRRFGRVRRVSLLDEVEPGYRGPALDRLLDRALVGAADRAAEWGAAVLRVGCVGETPGDGRAAPFGPFEGVHPGTR